MNKESTIQTITQKDIPALAKVYADVFAGAPWYEVSRCPSCNQFSVANPSEGAPCTCGGTYSLPAYPLLNTQEYISKETSRPGSVAVLSLQRQRDRNINGFGWGYQTTGSELSVAKYSQSEMQAVICDLLSKSGAFFYISEVGVPASNQGKGIGKALTTALIDTDRTSNVTVLRTSEDSSMRWIAEKLGMTAIIGLKTGIKDAENEKRVLFKGER